jgi:hypothetical protein
MPQCLLHSAIASKRNISPLIMRLHAPGACYKPMHATWATQAAADPCMDREFDLSCSFVPACSPAGTLMALLSDCLVPAADHVAFVLHA